MPRAGDLLAAVHRDRGSGEVVALVGEQQEVQVGEFLDVKRPIGTASAWVAPTELSQQTAKFCCRSGAGASAVVAHRSPWGSEIP